jgi:N-acetylglucosaminylphosphatidylinositol deacetylase
MKLIEDHIRERRAEGVDIKTIVTFDNGGVSHHPNHIDVHLSCMELYKRKTLDFDMYTLTTVPMFRKYDAFIDIFLTDENEVNYFLPSPFEAVTALMIHHSQFVWYRKLFMAFSRYVYYNGLIYYS